MRDAPLWIRAVLLFLVVAAVAARVPARPDDAVLARARDLVHERDPRRMSARELRGLPGVGEGLALAIAQTRDGHRGAAALRWEDVPGIGEVRARAIRAWCAERGLAPDPLHPGTGYARRVVSLARHLAGSLVALLAGCGTREPGAPVAPMQPERGETRADASTEVAVRTRTLALHGGALHARAAGPEDGPLVLLLHGARYTSATWEELGTLERLAHAGYHAVALDWPGYGASSAWSAVDAATLLASTCAALGAERASFVGASLGGGFALELAAAEPARVAALVAIAPAGAKTYAPSAWTLPTLLVWGERDEVLAPDVGRALAGRMDGARFELLPGAHACYLDEPERFHALLLEFLTSAVPAGE
jgi:abhydrolase domain-containing protein 14